MDTEALSIFVDCMRKLSFAGVARDRNIDPAKVTRTITSLEQALSVKLFQRSTRKITPTEAGYVYFGRVEPLLEELAAAASSVADISHSVRGTLRVTTSVSFGLKRLIPAAAEFFDRYPDLKFDLILTDENIDLIENHVDLALRLGTLQDSSYVSVKLMPTHYRICATPGYLERNSALSTPRHIEDHEAIVFNLPGFADLWHLTAGNGDQHRVTPKARYSISTALGVFEATCQGLGISLLPYWLIEESLLSGELIDLFPEYNVVATTEGTAVWGVYPSRHYLPAKTRLFLDYLKIAFKQ